MKDFFKAAKEEKEQFLKKNKRLSDALNTIQDKYSNMLKKLTVV